MFFVFMRSYLCLSITLIACMLRPAASDAAALPSPVEIRPLPSVVEFAAAHHIALDSFVFASRNDSSPGDELTVLFTIQEDTTTRQWLAELRIAPLTAGESKIKPGTGLGILSLFQSSLKTDTGHEFSFDQVPVALEIETHGPFSDSPGTTVNPVSIHARVLATKDYLAHGLAPMADIELRLRAAGKKNPGISLMFRPKFSEKQIAATKARANEAGFTEMDERTYAGAIYALVQFGNLAFKTEGPDAITHEIADSPTLFSGAFTNLVWPELRAEKSDDWGLASQPVFRVPYHFLSKTKAHGFFYFTTARPPLQNTAGFLGLTVDSTSKVQGKRLVMRVLAGRPGSPSAPVIESRPSSK